MDRNYPGAGFGDLGAGAGWSYERSAKASLVYGSSRSSHPESELLHRQAYATPHPLQSYATNHHPGSSGQGGAWGAAGRSLGLSGLFDAGLHHASPSGPDPSVMNLISALESRGPQPPPSASSLLSQFRTPSWQTAMHTPAPAELFISGALPGSGSFPSSSALSAYQHPASFSGRSFPGVTPSLSLQDTPTFSPTSNGLLSPHDPLLHIKTPSQSSLGFDRLLSSQGAAAAYRGSHDPSGGSGVTSAQASSAASASARHLQSHQFNLLSSQLQDQSSQLYSASVFSSAPAPPQPASQERTVPRQDSVIKHYQRPSPAQAPSSTPHPLQHYLSCGVSGYQQAPHPRHAGLSCSPLGEHSPSSDHKPSPRTEQYRPIIQPSYGSSSSSTSAGPGKAAKSSSSSGYSSSGSGSSSRTPHTPPSASSASSSSSSSSSSSASASARQSNSIPSSTSASASSRQQPPTQSVPPPQTHSQPAPSTNTSQQTLPKACLSGYGSPVAPVKSSNSLTGQTPPQQQPQSFSPSQPPSHLSQSYAGFSSPQTHDLPSARTSGVAKGYGNLGSQSFSAESVYGTDSGYVSLPPSLGGAGSPSMGYAASGHSPALLRSGASGGTAGGSSNGGSTSTGGGNNVAGGGGSYHIPDSSPSPSGNSGIIRPGLHSPAPSRPAQSPVGTGSNKYLSSVLSPSFLPSPQGYPDTRGPRSQSYHPSAPPKTKSDTSLLGVAESRPQQDDDDDDFLIQHLLQAQSPTPQASHHHPSQSHHSSQSTQQPPVLPTQDGSKGLSYEMGKSSEERYHLQSVIRTHSATTNAAVSGTGNGAGLDSQLEMSLKKQQHQQQHQTQHQQQQQQQHKHQQQQQKSSRPVTDGGGRGNPDQTHSHSHHHHDSMGSVVHYGRGDPYSQHSISQHPSSHHQHTPHTPTHSHLHSHPHMDLQKKPQESADMAYIRKTPDLQQHHHQQQSGHHQSHQQQHQQQQQQQHQSQSQTLMESPTDQSRQPPHLLQSVLSHTTRSKIDTQQQQHPASQQALMEASETHSQPQASQLQLQLQTQALEAASHYSHGSQQQDQNHPKSTTVSSLDMLERSLSRTSSQEGGIMDDRAGNEGGRGNSGAGTGGNVERHRSQDQQRLSSHHPSQHHPSELHSYLSEPDLGLSTPTHGHHLSHHHHQSQQPPQAQHPNSHHHAHPQHQTQQSHHHLASQPTSATAQQQEQSHSAQLPQAQLDQQHQGDHHFDSRGSAVKSNTNQNQSHQNQRFVPLTSICFPDSLLPDEERSFFPGMEDMFCPEEYKSSCSGGTGQGQDGVSQAQTGQEGMEGIKSTAEGGGDDTGASYDMLGHPGDQHYGQYCHELAEPDNGTMHLDLDSLKTHELPSTVNTEQLGLIQSQPTSLGMGSGANVGDGAGAKMVSSGGSGSGSGGLTSPIFCSSRPKKLLKSSSFHLLKERPDPNSLPKKSYAQEYEFEDDEDKADVPADIRLNSRRLPDLIPDLVSSCRKSSGGTMSPLMGDLDFGYPSLGPPPQLLPHDGPKKRGRKPTKPKREGPPRPRGRPRIRPLPEPHHSRAMIKLPIGTMSTSDALLRTDSLSGTDPALSDGSVGSAPSLGLSPGTPGVPDMNRPIDKNKSKTQDMEEKDSEKTGFVASFLDFLKSGKRPGSSSGNGDSSPGKSGGIHPISPQPPPPPAPTASSGYGDSEGDGGLSLGGCPSPCKRLDEELKRNLETLPSFSSDEEDSVGKNQDLQKSISSAISALYDTPQLSTSSMQPPSLPPPPPPIPPTPLTPTQQPPSLSPQTPTHMHTQSSSHTHPQSLESDILSRDEQGEEVEEEKMKDEDDEEEEQDKRLEEKVPEIELLGVPKVGDSPKEDSQAAAPPSLPPLFPSSPASSSSPSPPPLPPLSLPSPLPELEENPSPPQKPQVQQSSPPASPLAPSLPILSPPHPLPVASPPASETPTPPSPPRPQQPAPAPPSPEEPPAPQILPLHLAQKQSGAAIAGETDEDESESGGEGIFRERDEFVVRIEDIKTLKLALQTGREPPPIWRVQKALLQKFAPEIKDGQRQFCATSNYLGYFGDAKKRYQRLYVKFLENVNKKDYVRVCSRKPWHRPSVTLRRQSQSHPAPKMTPPPNNQTLPRILRDEKGREKVKEKEQRDTREKNNIKVKEQQEKERVTKIKEREEKKDKEKKMPPPPAPHKAEKRAAVTEHGKKEEKRAAGLDRKLERPTKQQPVKVKAEPPPKKRRKWLKEVPSSSDSDSSASDDEISVRAGLNTRAMREMYRSYVEMLVSTALDPDMIQALEDTEDELYLPPMRKIDSILSEQKRKLLKRVSMNPQHQEALNTFPQITAEPLDSGAVRVKLGGECYNRKTLNRVKKNIPKPQDIKLSTETCRLYSFYHSLHHYKYHTFLICKKETNTIEQASEDPGQEEVVQQCMANQSWLDTLFNAFLELMTLSAKA
ncbi:hypothetical protein QTP70_021901 [Hemibagrus guttatus]|uniref:DUF4211 domain-containing protein n=1 Tax=Hemibagrus guttatus TaxID=175788 RepID=A0AAE0QQX7_9TELE|nr:hypothetical protein QTP70_021901 [Hemibagrus guttatus]KAK3560122.1 hypothetical protein QTP86_033870 [Hemibagrus guttatus]